jgi:hypothetical protein
VKGVLLDREPQRWHCPNCGLDDTTPPTPPGTVASQFHPCPALKGLSAPMLPAGMDAKVEVKEWGDYENGELVQRDQDGRPVSAVITTRADGSNDTAVYAPSARLDMEDQCLIQATRWRG